MRLHTNIHTTASIAQALQMECNAGRIADSVGFKTLATHRSNTHERGIEVQLESYSKADGDGRRRGNSGSYGSMGAGDDFAATYDEWGWLIAALYGSDDEQVWGTVKYPQYADRDHFDFRTGLSYNPHRLIAQIVRDGADPYPFVSGRTNGNVGRRGAGREDGERGYADTYRRAEQNPGTLIDGWLRFAPRTIDDVLEFAHLDESDVAVLADMKTAL